MTAESDREVARHIVADRKFLELVNKGWPRDDAYSYSATWPDTILGSYEVVGELARWLVADVEEAASPPVRSFAGWLESLLRRRADR